MSLEPEYLHYPWRRHGYDHERGGLYNRGKDTQPASDTDKVWWVQAEMLAALTEALKNKPNAEYEVALKKLLDFVANFTLDGIRFWERPYFRGHDCHAWRVIGAWELAPFERQAQQYANRSHVNSVRSYLKLHFSQKVMKAILTLLPENS